MKGGDEKPQKSEVQIPASLSVLSKQHDLLRRAEDGYQPVFAVLRVGLLSDWLIALAENIGPGTVRKRVDACIKHSSTCRPKIGYYGKICPIIANSRGANDRPRGKLKV
jgi:hypothetical protein